MSGIWSCKRQSVIERNISEYVKKNANNPESYEPIEIKCIDTISSYKLAQAEIFLKVFHVKSDSEDVERYKDEMATASNEFMVKYYKEDCQKAEDKLKISRLELKAAQGKVDSLSKISGSKDATGYYFVHQFRAKVPLGGEMLKSALIETDKDFNITSFVEQ